MLVGMGAAMQAPHLRFFLIEHIPLMLLALILAHLGSRRARNAPDDQTKHRRGGDVHPGHAGHRRRYPLVASASAGPWVKHGPGGRTVEGRQARMWTGGS